MISFSTRIKRFEKNGEKTGWSFIEINQRQAAQINPGTRVSFRVKGSIDGHEIQKTSILPVGEGSFILPINGTIRKAIGKAMGDKVQVSLALDERALQTLEALGAIRRLDDGTFSVRQSVLGAAMNLRGTSVPAAGMVHCNEAAFAGIEATE